MPPGYLIAQIDVTDADAYRDHVAAVTPIVAAQGGDYPVRGGTAETVGGEAPGARTVVIDFPSLEVARAGCHGREYAETRTLRQAASRGVHTLVEGV